MLCPLCQTANSASSPRCRACGAPLKARANDAATSPDALPSGTLLMGAYAVESVLGQGGFGITYRCHDQMLDRSVAVKEFFPSGCRRENIEVQASRGLPDADFREARAQFLAEARVLARCHHVGIVGVYAAFEANQTAYMVMELLSGKTLAQLLTARGGAMNEAEAVGIIERVGEALQFVHEQNLLHRDIKPDNIIVCDDGRVMLIDFGTARETVQGQVQGQTVVVTPGYAPLEQYAKQARRGAFTDVYSLAATLYHLLTGQMPPAASDRAMGVQLRAVREFNPQISPAVAGAVERALQMEIARRPQSVREFLDLLHAPAEEAEAFFHPQISDLPFVDEDEESNGSIPAEIFADALRERQQTLNNSLPVINAQPVQLAPPRDFSSANISPDASALPHLSSGGVSGGVSVQNASGDDNSVRVFVWIVVIIAVIFGFVALISPRGPEKFATSSSDARATYQDAQPNSDTAQSHARQQAGQSAWDALPVLLPNSVQALPMSKGAKVPAAFTEKDGIKPWNNSVAFSPDGTRLALIDSAKTMRVLSLPDLQPIRSIALDKNYRVIDATISTDNETIAVTQSNSASSSDPTRVDVWNVRDGKRLGTFKIDSNEDYAWPQAVLSDERVLMRAYKRGSDQRKIFYWNPKNGVRSNAPIPPINDASWGYGVAAPDGKEFALGDSTGRLQWLDIKTGKPKHLVAGTLTGATYNNRFSAWNNGDKAMNSKVPLAIDYLNYAANGAYLASRDAAEIRVFDANARQLAALTIDGQQDDLMAISSDGQWLAARGALPDGPVGNLLWNVKTGQKIRLQTPLKTLLELSFSPDGQQLYGVFAQNDKFQMVTWPLDAAPVAAFAKVGEKTINTYDDIFESAKSATLANGAIALPLQNSVGFYGRGSGKSIRNLGEGASPATALKFSPDGKFLLIRKENGAMQGWRMGAGDTSARWKSAGNSENQNQSAAIREFYRTSRNLAFASDSGLFACARFTGSSSVVELWSLKTKPSLLARIAQPELVTALAFSPDDKSLICGGKDGLLQRINVATRQVQATAQTGEVVAGIAFADRKLIVLGGKTTRFYDWPASSRAELNPVAKREIPLGQMGSWALAADGESLAMVPQAGGDLQIWQLSRGQQVQSLGAISAQQASGSLTFSADGTQLTALQAQSDNQLLMRTWARNPTK